MVDNLKNSNESKQMEVIRKINATAIIQEVEKHPHIYDNKYPNHTQLSAEVKKKTWEIIAEKLCGSERWQNCDEPEKEAIAKEIQFKWKNLKDNFMRILKKEKEDDEHGINLKRRKYVYYDMLNFLRPFAPLNRRSNDAHDDVDIGGKNASNIIYINETKEESEDESNTQTSPSVTHKAIQIPPPIAPLPSFGTLQPVQLIQIQPNAVRQNIPPKDESEDTTHQKLTQVLENILQVQVDEKNDDPMDNKKFLMSLLPFMKKLPDDVNLEVRLQIMGVLHSYGGKLF